MIDQQRPVSRSEEACVLMSPKALAALLEVTPLTLQRWRDLGKGPAWHQFPGSNVIRYARADVLCWLASNRVSTGGER